MSEEYFIRMRGRVTGPFGLEELRSMLRLGTLSRVHDVSIDRSNWLPVGSVAELLPAQTVTEAVPLELASEPETSQGVMDLAGGGGGGAVPPAGGPPPRALPPTAVASPPWVDPAMAPLGGEDVNEPEVDAAKQFNRLSLADGICVGVVLLICTNIPFTRSGGSLVWWWDLWGQDGGGMFLVFSIYAMIAGVTLIFIASLTKGLSRGWSYLIAAGLGFFLLTIAMIAGPNGCGYMASPFLLPAPLVAMMGVLLFRRDAAGAGYARSIQVIAASLLCLAGLGAGVLIVIGLSGSGADGSVPIWAIAAIILSVISSVAALACAICGLVSSSPAYSTRMTVTIVILGISSLSLFLVSGVVFGFGVASVGFEGARFVLVFVLRFLVTTYSLAVLLAVGLFEVMAYFRNSLETAETVPGPAKEQSI